MSDAFRSDRALRRLGSLTVYCGPTHSGKTKKLEAEAERALRQGREVQRFAPADGAASPGVERIAGVGALLPALRSSTELVIIDDAQSLGGELVTVVEELATNWRVDVVVAGWELDYGGHPAGPLPELMCKADAAVKLGDGVCGAPGCRNLASRTQRFVTSDNPRPRFLPVCRRHHDPTGRVMAFQQRWFEEPSGLLEVIAGCMFSGKTLELIRRLDQERYAGASSQVFKPALDDRYDADDVASHRETRVKANPVADVRKIPEMLRSETTVIGIDEVQFFGAEIASLAEGWVNAGRHVILTGLDLDFLGRPFGPMPLLLAQADRLAKLAASCQFPGCGSRQATRTQRLVNGAPARPEDPLVVVGGSALYQARCRHHHEIPEPALTASAMLADLELL